MDKQNSVFITLGIVVLVVIFTITFCLKTAGPGEVGIKVNLAGDNRGVDDIPVETGRIFYNPIMQQVVVYPTYTQTYTWTADSTEHSPGDESITFTDVDGTRINADITFAFRLDPAKVPSLYIKHRVPVEQIIRGYLRNAIRDEFSRVASTLSIDEIYGSKKAWVPEEVTERLNKRLAVDGFVFDFIGFVGDLRLPDVVQKALDQKIEATQRALQRENELREARAEAEKQVATAEGRARARLADAEGEAKAVLLQAEAQAEANKILVDSLGGADNYVALENINKLNDSIQIMVVPAGSSPIIGLDGLISKK